MNVFVESNKQQRMVSKKYLAMNINDQKRTSLL